uniref:Candidate secreted effector n=1 Tax=Meloidogyne incognita TaxID=6306 RepID=A0A914L6F3_MELIC
MVDSIHNRKIKFLSTKCFNTLNLFEKNILYLYMSRFHILRSSTMQIIKSLSTITTSMSS